MITTYQETKHPIPVRVFMCGDNEAYRLENYFNREQKNNYEVRFKNIKWDIYKPTIQMPTYQAEMIFECIADDNMRFETSILVVYFVYHGAICGYDTIKSMYDKLLYAVRHPGDPKIETDTKNGKKELKII